jgi:hypothetical protein
VICPECDTEYREGFTRCADCDVALEPPPPPPPPDERHNIELVNVWEGGNPALLAVVESVLDDAGIEYSTTSENLQDLFAGGRFGTGFNNLIGPVKFFVRAEDESEARTLLDQMENEPPPELPADESA